MEIYSSNKRHDRWNADRVNWIRIKYLRTRFWEDMQNLM